MLESNTNPLLPKEQRVIMISGANRGIGRNISVRLYKEGYSLSLSCRDLEKRDVELQTMSPEQVLWHPYDARKKETASKWVEATFQKFGRIDGLVNNAGVLHQVPFEVDHEELLDDMWEVNAKAPLRLTRLAFPHLRQSGCGRVIHVVSMSGRRVKGRSVGYAMSKFAAMAVSYSTQINGWDDGIRVTALCPGFVNTEMVVNHSPLPPATMIQPEQLADMVSMLLQLPNNAVIPELQVLCEPEVTR